MKKEKIIYNEEMILDALFIKDLPGGKLFYCQDKLVVTNCCNHIIDSLDIIEFINDYLT